VRVHGTSFIHEAKEKKRKKKKKEKKKEIAVSDLITASLPADGSRENDQSIEDWLLLNAIFRYSRYAFSWSQGPTDCESNCGTYTLPIYYSLLIFHL